MNALCIIFFTILPAAFVCHAVRTESSWVQIIVFLFAWSCLRRRLANKLSLMMDNTPSWPLTWEGGSLRLSLRSYKTQNQSSRTLNCTSSIGNNFNDIFFDL